MNNASRPQLHRYRMSGLKIESVIELPMRPLPMVTGQEEPDVRIELDDVPEQLDQVLHSGANWEINSDCFLLKLPGIGRFMAVNGRRLVICPAPGMAVADVLIFATGTGMCAILYQRGATVLHASAVVRNGHGFLFCGPSGAGKSTLSGALCRAGCAFLSDDLSVVTVPDHGPPIVEADGRALRLFPDSIDSLDLAPSVGPPVRQLVDKFHVTPPTIALDGAKVPIAAIYMLTNADPAGPQTIVRMPPLNAAQALLRQSYRRQIALAYAEKSGLAARIGAIVAETGVYHLDNPRDLKRLDYSIDGLMAHWRSLGLE